MARHVVSVPLSSAGIGRAINELTAYRQRLIEKTREITRRLAEHGMNVSQVMYSGAPYDGTNDVTVTMEPTERGYRVVASGRAVLFIEFGAGVTYGYGHPQATEFGMGPGTYPSDKGHWDDPEGWYLPKSAGGGSTMGNPPSMAMYNASQLMRDRITQIVREVFST